MREFITHEWLTILCFAGLLFITFAKLLNSARFYDFIALAGNSKYLKIYSKDQKFIDLFDGLLFTNLVISLSIFAHIAYSNLVDPIAFSIVPFLRLVFAVAVILLVKTLIERLVGSLFDIESILESYLFQKTAYKNLTGIVLLICNLILLYALEPNEILIYVAISLALLVNIMGFIITYKTHLNTLNRHLFYFLLYLCALEIGPYVILYKVITEYNT
ncbi:DUF4271 domain-containing protein [Winogradskyella maritima]|uniref:DUF4271 domain-containing protein n=1 Tax=Winogradskyella maritima TaxID=1517766 RepID=A0ABV8AET7_9FLAO|nr:DUF4271 domain-containing protein [Winogradskyella maritima]